MATFTRLPSGRWRVQIRRKQSYASETFLRHEDARQWATAAAFNRAVYDRLKPGGFYVIVDHAAATGAGVSDAQTLHRIEPAFVREEVEAAGFVLDAESNVLENEDDPHSNKVFDPSIKGKTDRFAYRFVKR